jgi:hypothetical protein
MESRMLDIAIGWIHHNTRRGHQGFKPFWKCTKETREQDVRDAKEERG